MGERVPFLGHSQRGFVLNSPGWYCCLPISLPPPRCQGEAVRPGSGRDPFDTFHWFLKKKKEPLLVSSLVTTGLVWPSTWLNPASIWGCFPIILTHPTMRKPSWCCTSLWHRLLPLWQGYLPGWYSGNHQRYLQTGTIHNNNRLHLSAIDFLWINHSNMFTEPAMS